jgi:hypothetical protein
VAIELVGRERITGWTQPIRSLAARLDWRGGHRRSAAVAGQER